MEIKQPFIKVSAPSSDLQVSPRPPMVPQQVRMGEARRLSEARIGNFLVKAERVSQHSIDGYTTVYDQHNNLLFEGEYSRAKKNGYGVEFNTTGTVYEGNFRDDKYDGWGKTVNYSGEFRDGFYDGYGVYSSSKIYYEGFFTRGLFNGEGVYFTGESMSPFHPVRNINTFLTDSMKNNLDIMERYKIDEIYLGEWKEGNKHGFGRIWKKDYWYAGQFSNNVPHGFGAEEDRKSNKVSQTKYRLGAKID